MRNFLVELRKIFTSAGFYICVIFTVILLFCAEIYTEPQTMDRYSVINALLHFPREELSAHLEFGNSYVMSFARSGWITLFVPIITAFCFVPQICAERGSKAMRYGIFRSSKLGYNFSRCFAGIFSGGLSMSLGYAVFCGAVYFLFPSSSDAFFAFSFWRAILGMWLYGTFWSVPAMFFSSVTGNKYLIICIPFFLKYAFTQTVYMLQNKAFSAENVNNTLLKIIGFINPESLLYIDQNAVLWQTLLFYGITAAVFIAGFTIIQCNRRDCGE